MIDLWLNCQTAGDYNPTHTHGGSFSGVIFLKVPPQINANSLMANSASTARRTHIQSFRTGMAHYVLPVPGEFYVFAWQPHSVMPFREDGNAGRWRSMWWRPRCSAHSDAAARPQQQPLGNVSLSVSDPRPRASDENCQSLPIASVQDSWVIPSRSSGQSDRIGAGAAGRPAAT